MTQETQTFVMIELKSGKKHVAIEMLEKVFLAFHPEPISEVFNDDYVQGFIRALRDEENNKKIYESRRNGEQVMIRLETVKGEQPWWAPAVIHRIPVENQYDNILIILRKEPIPINHY